MIALQFEEQLPPVVADELNQLIAGVQSAMTGNSVGLLLGLQFREQLPPIVADELDQLTASIQTAFNKRVWIKTNLSGTITIPTGSLSKTILLPSVVDPSNTLVTWLGQTTDLPTAGQDEYSPCFYESRLSLLADGRTLTAFRGTSSANYTCTTGYSILEMQPGLLKSVQRGTIAMGFVSTSKTGPILPVDPTRARVELLGYTTTYSDFGIAANLEGSNLHKVRLALTDATTVTAFTNSVGGDDVVGYQVAEYF